MPRSCSIAATLQVVGERWALLVVREVALGVRRFDTIVEATGAPRAVVAARLRELVAAGVLVAEPYQEPGQRARHEYRLTASGRELQPVLSALMAWGDAHLAPPEGPPVVLRHDGCGGHVRLRQVCDCGEELAPGKGVRAEPVH